jgi:hypothetical protein
LLLAALLHEGEGDEGLGALDAIMQGICLAQRLFGGLSGVGESVLLQVELRQPALALGDAPRILLRRRRVKRDAHFGKRLLRAAGLGQRPAVLAVEGGYLAAISRLVVGRDAADEVVARGGDVALGAVSLAESAVGFSERAGIGGLCHHLRGLAQVLERLLVHAELACLLAHVREGRELQHGIAQQTIVNSLADATESVESEQVTVQCCVCDCQLNADALGERWVTRALSGDQAALRLVASVIRTGEEQIGLGQAQVHQRRLAGGQLAIAEARQRLDGVA